MAFRIRKPSQESFFALNAIPLYSYAIPLGVPPGSAPFLLFTDALFRDDEPRGVAAPIGDVVGRGFSQAGDRRIVQRALHFGWRPHDERAVGKYLALGQERARPDQAAPTDFRAVENNRAHADQRSVPDRATVQDGIVSNRAILSNEERKAHVGMQSATFLDIRAGADRYRFVVAAQRRAEPNPAILPQNDVADDASVGRDPIAILGRQSRPAVVKCVNRHDDGSGRGKSVFSSRSADRLLRRQVRFWAPERCALRVRPVGALPRLATAAKIRP